MKITIELYFDEDGNLIIDGYDIGDTVLQYWGDSDYEYSTTVEPDEVKKLYDLFKLPVGDSQALLMELQSRFHDDHCYSQLRDFLGHHDLRFKSFSWV